MRKAVWIILLFVLVGILSLSACESFGTEPHEPEIPESANSGESAE